MSKDLELDYESQMDLALNRRILLVNIRIAKNTGIIPSFVFAILLEKYKQARQEKKTIEFNSNHHFFSVPLATLVEDTNLGYKALNGALGKLKKDKLIFSKLAGIPASSYFCINPTELLRNL